MNITLSVIVPMYNVENYIDDCIQSILNQTLKEIEIIIIDDGSTDSSYLKALIYQKENDEKIKLFKQDNKGQASARNFGLLKARGKYIAFVDSDDFIDKDMFLTMTLEAEESELDIVQCNYLNWFGKNSADNFKYEYQNVDSEIHEGRKYYNFDPSLSPCDKVFKKQFLDEIEFSFEEGRYAEDALEISKAFYFAKKVKYIDAIFYYYRRNSFNSTRNSIDLNKSIKLGIDKIFIAYSLNQFKKSKNWNGAIRRVIIRNIIGSFMKKEIINKKYRSNIINEFRKRKALWIILENINISDIKSFINLGFKKLYLKRE